MRIVFLTGAGVSAESGIKTFRDSGGLWEGHDIMDVASPEGWKKNKQLVLDFYNTRRKQALEVLPNAAHIAIADLQNEHEVIVITQNVDDLHERAGSKNVIHLHGELNKMRSSANSSAILPYTEDIKIGDKCPLGSQLRPHIVWFGEDVPMISVAAQVALKAEVFVVVGTSLQVYPAAGLIGYVGKDVPKFILDPNTPPLSRVPNLVRINKTATEGVIELLQLIREL